MLLNISDTNLSIADIEELGRPVLQGALELAPYHDQSYRFGDYVIEQVQQRRPSSWWCS